MNGIDVVYWSSSLCAFGACTRVLFSVLLHSITSNLHRRVTKPPVRYRTVIDAICLSSTLTAAGLWRSFLHPTRPPNILTSPALHRCASWTNLNTFCCINSKYPATQIEVDVPCIVYLIMLHRDIHRPLRISNSEQNCWSFAFGPHFSHVQLPNHLMRHNVWVDSNACLALFVATMGLTHGRNPGCKSPVIKYL